jgi:hypothetical protein
LPGLPGQSARQPGLPGHRCSTRAGLPGLPGLEPERDGQLPGQPGHRPGSPGTPTLAAQLIAHMARSSSGLGILRTSGVVDGMAWVFGMVGEVFLWDEFSILNSSRVFRMANRSFDVANLSFAA